jgi:hypothetical protein
MQSNSVKCWDLTLLVQLRWQQTKRSGPPLRLLDQLLVGEMIECSNITDFSTIDDKPANLGFSESCHRHRGAILRFARDLPRIFELVQYGFTSGFDLATVDGNFTYRRLVRYAV